MDAKYKKSVGAGVAILMITVFFIPVLANAIPPGEAKHDRAGGKKGHHRPVLGIWQDPQLVEDLALTDEQIKQVREADFASREKHLALKAQLDSYRLQMRKAFSADTVDETAVRQLAQNIANIKGKSFVQEIESRLALGRILNEDQIKKLKSHAMQQKWNSRKHGKKRVSAHLSLDELCGQMSSVK